MACAQVVDALISGYTREAGVRELDRQLAALCRSIAAKAAEAAEAKAEAAANSSAAQAADEAALEAALDEEAGIDGDAAAEVAAADTADAPEAPEALATVDPPEAPATVEPAVAAAEAELEEPGVVNAEVLTRVLGPPKYDGPRDNAYRMTKPGIVAGLAYTSVGGDLLYVEAEQVMAPSWPPDWLPNGPSWLIAIDCT